MVYSKDFLIEAFVSRYVTIGTVESFIRLWNMADTFYDKVGKDKFREYCSLDADAIRKYREQWPT